MTYTGEYTEYIQCNRVVETLATYIFSRFFLEVHDSWTCGLYRSTVKQAYFPCKVCVDVCMSDHFGSFFKYQSEYDETWWQFHFGNRIVIEASPVSIVNIDFQYSFHFATPNSKSHNGSCRVPMNEKCWYNCFFLQSSDRIWTLDFQSIISLDLNRWIWISIWYFIFNIRRLPLYYSKWIFLPSSNHVSYIHIHIPGRRYDFLQ